MSRAYQIAVVQTVRTETVRLADILGRVPTRQFASALESEWAREEGWRKNGDVYTLQVTDDVAMEIRITGEEVVVQRRVSERVTRALEGETRAKQELLLESATDAYQLRFNKVLGRAMLLAVADTLLEQQKITADTPIVIQEVGGCYEMQFDFVKA